jgi:hypothetical protein
MGKLKLKKIDPQEGAMPLYLGKHFGNSMEYDEKITEPGGFLSVHFERFFDELCGKGFGGATIIGSQKGLGFNRDFYLPKGSSLEYRSRK